MAEVALERLRHQMAAVWMAGLDERTLLDLKPKGFQTLTSPGSR